MHYVRMIFGLCALSTLAACGLPRAGGYSEWAGSAEAEVGSVKLQYRQVGVGTYQALAMGGTYIAQQDAMKDAVSAACKGPVMVTFDGVIGMGGFHEMTIACRATYVERPIEDGHGSVKTNNR